MDPTMWAVIGIGVTILISIARSSRAVPSSRERIVMPPPDPDNRNIDWTGTRPDESSLAPLDGATFLARLRRLEQCAHDLAVLRRAMTGRPAHDDRLHLDPERASRPAR